MLKSIFNKLVPSYRIGNSILTEEYELLKKLYNLEEKFDDLQQDIKNIGEKNEYLFWLSSQREGESIEETKKRIFLNLPKATGDLRKIQLAENYILQRVKDICDANDIHFWLGYGTLLGAIRHRGFIPWDDDIDICMMREDCNKLFSIIKNDAELDINKYFMGNASYITKVKFKEDECIFVDIFTFDYFDCDSDEEAAAKFEETQKITADCQAFNAAILADVGFEWRDKIRPTKCENAINKIDENYNKAMDLFPHYGYGNYIGLGINMSERFRADDKLLPAECYFPLKYNKIVFEGKMYDAPANLNRILENLFGDIWSFPPSINCPHLSEFEGYEEVISRLNLN